MKRHWLGFPSFTRFFGKGHAVQARGARIRWRVAESGGRDPAGLSPAPPRPALGRKFVRRFSRLQGGRWDRADAAGL